MKTNKDIFIKNFIKIINNTKFYEPNPTSRTPKKEEEKNILEYKEKIIDICRKSLEGNYGKFDSFWNQWNFEGGYLSVSLGGQMDFIFNSPDWFSHKSKRLNEYYKIIRQFALGKEVVDENIFDSLGRLKSKII